MIQSSRVYFLVFSELSECYRARRGIIISKDKSSGWDFSVQRITPPSSAPEPPSCSGCPMWPVSMSVEQTFIYNFSSPSGAQDVKAFSWNCSFVILKAQNLKLSLKLSVNLCINLCIKQSVSQPVANQPYHRSLNNSSCSNKTKCVYFPSGVEIQSGPGSPGHHQEEVCLRRLHDHRVSGVCVEIWRRPFVGKILAHGSHRPQNSRYTVISLLLEF